jgi:DUF4097 and DUF4098 domain-containing protein YvlB
MRSLLLSAAAAAVLAAAPLAAQDHSADRNATVNAANARAVRIVARAGRLRVVGVDGITEVRVRGTARARKESRLDDIELRAEREGDEVVVEALIPEDRVSWHWDDEMALDLVIEVPRALPLEVEDGSGDVELRNVGALRLDDGSGNVEIVGARGDVTVKDGSGGLTVREVKGSVTIADGSGEIEVANVTGTLTVDEDGSGGITARDVGGAVHVRRDGSGQIRVTEVGGDFVVDRDGSGGISSQGVKGEIRLPRS